MKPSHPLYAAHLLRVFLHQRGDKRQQMYDTLQFVANAVQYHPRVVRQTIRALVASQPIHTVDPSQKPVK